jgi:hypothetical protein
MILPRFPFHQADKKSLAFEQEWLDVVEDHSSSGVPESVKVYRNAARSFGDASAGAITGDLQFLFGGYILVFVYVIFVLGRRNVVEIKVRIGLAYKARTLHELLKKLLPQ